MLHQLILCPFLAQLFFAHFSNLLWQLSRTIMWTAVYIMVLMSLFVIVIIITTSRYRNITNRYQRFGIKIWSRHKTSCILIYNHFSHFLFSIMSSIIEKLYLQNVSISIRNLAGIIEINSPCFCSSIVPTLTLSLISNSTSLIFCVVIMMSQYRAL